MHAIDTQDKQFHDGNGTTELGTILPAWWLNQVQNEILAVLQAAKITPNKAKQTQLAEAINALLESKATTPLNTKANTATTITAGNGLTGGGTLQANRTLTLGTPSSITATSTNSTTATSHTHEIAKASTTVAGIVKLNNSLSSTSQTEALTAAQGKILNENIAKVQTAAAAKQSPATTLAGYGITDFIRKEITSENLNDIKTAGVYTQRANVNATAARNYPQATAGALLVYPAPYGAIQEYICFQNYERYIRSTQANGNFSNWKRSDMQNRNKIDLDTAVEPMFFTNPTVKAGLPLGNAQSGNDISGFMIGNQNDATQFIAEQGRLWLRSADTNPIGVDDWSEWYEVLTTKGTGQSIGTNGWTKMPNGLILQWGQVNATTNHNFVTVNYPIAFNTVFSVTATGDFGTSTWWDNMCASVTTKNITKTNFQAAAHSDYASQYGTGNKIHWFAIGR